MNHSWSFMTICFNKTTRVAPKNNYCLDYRLIFVPKKTSPLFFQLSKFLSAWPILHSSFFILHLPPVRFPVSRSCLRHIQPAKHGPLITTGVVDVLVRTKDRRSTVLSTSNYQYSESRFFDASSSRNRLKPTPSRY